MADTGNPQPKPPFPEQKQDRPGIEAQMNPRPEYEASRYAGSGKLEGKVALVTGGDSGIGRAVAVLFAREGADVAIVHLPEEQVDGEETVRAVEREGRRALQIPGDLRDPAFCREAVERTVAAFNHLDILVNNAAYQHRQERPEDITDEQWDRTFRTNIYGYFYMVRAALPHLSDGCTIINTGSITGLEGNKQLLDYSATKGAIHAFTKSLAQNVIDKGIRVNAVAPGPVWTPLNPSDSPAEKMPDFGADSDMKRAAQPEELSPAYVYLASPVCSGYVTGIVLPVTGSVGAI